jgi:hypothetical protein
MAGSGTAMTNLDKDNRSYLADLFSICKQKFSPSGKNWRPYLFRGIERIPHFACPFLFLYFILPSRMLFSPPAGV